jgi:hypothetical protein
MIVLLPLADVLHLKYDLFTQYWKHWIVQPQVVAPYEEVGAWFLPILACLHMRTRLFHPSAGHRELHAARFCTRAIFGIESYWPV